MQRLALLAGVGVVFVWGANFAMQKALFDVMPPAAFLCARYLLLPACAALPLPRADALCLAWLGVGAVGRAVAGRRRRRWRAGPRPA